MGVLFALLAGLLMSVQGVFNTRLMESSSMWVTNLWVQFSALLVTVFIWLFFDTKNILTIFNTENKLYLIGGVIGAFITFSVIKSIDKLGPAQGTMLILISQLIISYSIEIFALFGTDKIILQWDKLIAIALMITGIIVFKK